MRVQHSIRRSQLAALLLILVIHASVSDGAEYTFVKVADSASGDFRFIYPSQLNDGAQVAFDAELSDGTLGIALWQNGQPELVIAAGQPFENGRISNPTLARLNNNGVIAFSALRFGSVTTGLRGVFTIKDDTITRIAPLDPQAPHSSLSLAINNRNLVAFDAPNPSHNNILAGDGTRVYPIALGDEFRASMSVHDLNDSGQVAFDAFGIDDRRLYVGDGTHTETIAIARHFPQPGEFDNFPDIKINESGLIVFNAHIRDNGYVLYKSVNGQRTALASTSEPDINLIEGFEINDRGDLVFSTTLDQGGSAIFLQTDEGRQKILQTGDVLLGAPVTDVAVREINNAGVIMFSAGRADGSRGLYLAIPEPTNIALAIVGSLVVIACRIRRMLMRYHDQDSSKPPAQ